MPSIPVTRYRRLISFVLAVYWSALFVSTHVPVPQSFDFPEGSDKGLHWAAYAGLGFLSCLWRSVRIKRFTAGQYAGIGIVLAIYGLADELLQIPVHRTADVVDYLFDLLGIGSGLLAFAATRKWLSRYWESIQNRQDAPR